MASAARSFSKSSSCYFHLSSSSSLCPCLMSEAVDVGSLSWSVQLGLFLYMITRRLIIPKAASLLPSVTLDREKRLSLFFAFFLPSLFFCVIFLPCFSSPIRCSVSGTEQRCFSGLSSANWRCTLSSLCRGLFPNNRSKADRAAERPLLLSIMTSLHSAAGVCSFTNRFQIWGGRTHTVFSASDLL